VTALELYEMLSRSLEETPSFSESRVVIDMSIPIYSYDDGYMDTETVSHEISYASFYGDKVVLSVY